MPGVEAPPPNRSSAATTCICVFVSVFVSIFFPFYMFVFTCVSLAVQVLMPRPLCCHNLYLCICIRIFSLYMSVFTSV